MPHAAVDINVRDFLDLLRGKGFAVDVDDYLTAERIRLYAQKNKKSINEYRHALAAITCRNAEEQQQFHECFDAFFEQHFEEVKLETEQQSKKKRLLLYVLSGLFFLAAVLIFFFAPISKTDYARKIRIIHEKEHSIIGKYQSSIAYDENYNNRMAPRQSLYQKFFQPHYDTAGVHFNWHVDKEHFENRKQLSFDFNKQGKYPVSVDVKTPQGDTIYKEEWVICDELPVIIGNDSVAVGEEIALEVANNTENKKLIWTVDGRDTINQKWPKNGMRYAFKSKGNHDVSCKFEGQFCEHNRNIKSIHVTERNDFRLLTDNSQGDSGGMVVSNSLLCRILIIVFFLLLLMALLAYLFTDAMMRLFFKKYLNRHNYYAKELSANPEKKTAPFDIQFFNQDKYILEKDFMHRWAISLQKKIESEESKLNYRKTIYATIRNEDILNPVFENKNERRSWLFLIDETYATSAQVQLFRYLVQQLSKRQVELETYYYARTPLHIYRSRPDQPVSINYIKNRQYNSVLVVFGDGHNFLDPHFSEIYHGYKTAFEFWPKRILITPKPSVDWSVNENTLASFFHTVPADIDGLLLTFQILQGHYKRKISNENATHNYSIERVRFDDIDALESYLDAAGLFQWMAATAVYPKISWEIMLAIGHAIDPNLVTYENLLRLARIEWMHSSGFPTRIRLELLKKLSIANEIKARETIIKLLEQDSIRVEGSYSDEERKMQLITNKFMLYSHKPEDYGRYKDSEQQFLQLYQSGKVMDIPLKIYLSGQDPDISGEVWKTPIVENATLDDYLQQNLQENDPKKKIIDQIKRKLLPWLLLFSTAFLLLLITAYRKFEIPGLIDKQQILPAEWHVSLIKNECFEAFQPTKVEILQNGRRLFSDNVNQEWRKPPIRFSKVKDQWLDIRFISETDTITNRVQLQRNRLDLRISARNCSQIHAVYDFGSTEDYKKYEQIIGKYFKVSSGQSPTDRDANYIMYADDIDSLLVYEMCADLIQNGFPLSGLEKSALMGKDEKVLIYGKVFNKLPPLLTLKDLRCRFYNECDPQAVVRQDSVVIQYNEAKQKAIAEKLAASLRKVGYFVAPVSQLQLDGENELRYYDLNKKDNATKLKRLAENTMKQMGENGVTFKLQKYQNSLPEKRTDLFKIWIKNIEKAPDNTNTGATNRPTGQQVSNPQQNVTGIDCDSRQVDDNNFVLFYKPNEIELSAKAKKILDGMMALAKKYPKASLRLRIYNSNPQNAKDRSDIIKNYVNPSGLMVAGQNNETSESGSVLANNSRECLQRIELTLSLNNNTPGKRILWLDDNPYPNESVVNRLRKMGITVDLASTNEQAYTAVAKNNYRFIITDLDREKSETGVKDRYKAGFEFVRKVKFSRSDIIILTNGNTQEYYRHEIDNLGVRKVLTDVYILQEFLEKEFYGR